MTMEFPDPCVWFAFPGQRLGASVTCPLHSGDDQRRSFHDHCELKDRQHSSIAERTYLTPARVTQKAYHMLTQPLWLCTTCGKKNGQTDWFFLFLTGDSALLQKSLHSCISQLLAGQTRFGEHDSEWSAISLYNFFHYFHLSISVVLFCWHAIAPLCLCHFSSPALSAMKVNHKTFKLAPCGLILKFFTFCLHLSCYILGLLHNFLISCLPLSFINSNTFISFCSAFLYFIHCFLCLFPTIHLLFFNPHFTLKQCSIWSVVISIC